MGKHRSTTAREMHALEKEILAYSAYIEVANRGLQPITLREIAERLREMALRMKKMSYGFYLKVETVKKLELALKECQVYDKKFTRNQIVEIALSNLFHNIGTMGIEHVLDVANEP